MSRHFPIDPTEIAARIRDWSTELGFSACGIAGIELADDAANLLEWLAQGRHGELHYMARYGVERARPAGIVPGTVRVIAVRLDYWPGKAAAAETVLADAERAYVSRYALGRDYHRLMRNRLQQLAERIAAVAGPHGHRVFVDSGPVMEKPLARNAGLGWIGKHTNLIDSRNGSYFFLGELLTDLPLPLDAPASDHCGSCHACLDACPTRAITAPYQLDARRCISYLTIELHGDIPVEFRKAIGNRVYGCDDCQLVCPWNKFARVTREPDFEPRHALDAERLVTLFGWTEAEFLERMAGSAIRRIGYARWLRNLAVGLGNAPRSAAVLGALQARRDDPSALVRSHVSWALAQHAGRDV
jgi:epoxyqueuosine reductase